MLFLIVPMRKRGVARSKRDIANAEPVTGDIIFFSAPREQPIPHLCDTAPGRVMSHRFGHFLMLA